MRSPRLWFRSLIVLVRVARRLASGYLLIQFLWPFMDQRARDASVQLWCRDMLRVLGIRLSAAGHPLPQPADEGLVLISNHISWVDTVAIHAVVPCGFLAKASLQGWPIIGRLVEKTGGVFVQRGNPFDLKRALDAMAGALATGRSICVFPEGTTTDGTALAVFSTLVFELSARCGARVLPIGVRYRQRGVPTRLAAWIGDEAFVPSLFRIAGADGLEVELIAGELLPPVLDRARAAEHARQRVAALVEIPVSSEPVAATAAEAEDNEPHGNPRVAHLAEAVRAWIAAERELSPMQITDRASLRSLGIDSLAILRMVLELEEGLGLRVDESKLELSSNATVMEFSAAVVRSEL